jgi:4-hydroxy-3-methylbut-2-enyl diphosphate reductase
VHGEVLRYAARGFEILVVGHPEHVEVIGTLGHAPGRTQVVPSTEAADAVRVRDSERVAAVTQTTLSVDDAEAILARLRRRFPRLQTPRKEDVCFATQNRQNAVKQLARRAQLVLVAGSASSSNTARLVEVARAAGARAERLADARELRPAWLDSVSAVGVTAGASAPESLVESLVARLVDLGCGPVETLPGPEERLSFALPPELAAREPHGDAA